MVILTVEKISKHCFPTCNWARISDHWPLTTCRMCRRCDYSPYLWAGARWRPSAPLSASSSHSWCVPPPPPSARLSWRPMDPFRWRFQNYIGEIDQDYSIWIKIQSSKLSDRQYKYLYFFWVFDFKMLRFSSEGKSCCLLYVITKIIQIKIS